MKALILAAGLGSRLKHKTENIPKAMVLVNDMPIVTHQINALIENGIDQVGVVLGYKGEVLKKYLLKEHKKVNFTFFTNPRYDSSNSAYSFYISSSFIKDEDYIHLNCDIIFSSKLLKKIINNDKKNVIAVNLREKKYNNMELVKINQMKRILFMNNKIFKGAMGKAYGLAKLSSQSSEFIINKIEKFLVNNDFNQNYYGIIRDSLNHIEYYCEDCNDLLLSEVNTLEDFALVQSKNNAVKNE